MIDIYSHVVRLGFGLSDDANGRKHSAILRNNFNYSLVTKSLQAVTQAFQIPVSTPLLTKLAE